MSIEVHRIIIHQVEHSESQAPIDETCNANNINMANAQAELSDLLVALQVWSFAPGYSDEAAGVTIAFQPQ